MRWPRAALLRGGNHAPVPGQPAGRGVQPVVRVAAGGGGADRLDPLDVMVVLDTGVLGRPELTTVVDVATRAIAAAVLRPGDTKAVDATLLLARMLVPEPMRPGWADGLRMSVSRLPYESLVAIDDRLQLAAAKPLISPETIVIDHGKVFVSEVFTRSCESLGISVQPARPHTPTDKAIVERTFPSINTLFCQHVAGYTGRGATPWRVTWRDLEQSLPAPGASGEIPPTPWDESLGRNMHEQGCVAFEEALLPQLLDDLRRAPPGSI